MPLTLEQLHEYRDEAMADDIGIEFERMRLWSEDHARAFFESGGQDVPPEATPSSSSSHTPGASPAADPVAPIVNEPDEAPAAPDPAEVAKAQVEAEASRFKERLAKSGVGVDVYEVLKRSGQTIGTLVHLIRNDRPKFLPSLKEYGVAKLPDRQKVRDLINEIANPPEGSEDKLREEYADELARYPWCLLEAEKFIARNQVDSMVHAIPQHPGHTLRKYLIREKDGVELRAGRETQGKNARGTVSGFPRLALGEVVVGDEESWAIGTAELMVHVYVPNVVSGTGFMQGWIPYMATYPLDESGARYPTPAIADYQMQRQIQDYFERGYLQLGMQKAIAAAITERPAGMTYRQACDLVYMQCRGPALMKLGFEPTAAGLALWMDSCEPSDDLSSLSDAEFLALVDAHNRIVALMGGNSPAKIPDALAARRAGSGFGSAAAAAKAKEERERELADLAAAEEVAAAAKAKAAEEKAKADEAKDIT